VTVAPFTTGATVTREVEGITFTGLAGVYPQPPIWYADKSSGGQDYKTRNRGPNAEPRRAFDVFLDVPYVAAPVDRWKMAAHGVPSDPVDCTRWKGVPWQNWETEESGEARPTFGLDVPQGDWAALGAVESEDCHNMIIFAPSPIGSNRPVLFFIPGGGGDVGASQLPIYWAARVAAEGTVAVIVNYRRGYLGHFWHPELEAEDDYDGPNFALGDVRAALKWCRSHIADFGGDPDNIALSGSSVGGALALALATDPAAAGDFAKVWAISPGGNGERPRAPRQSSAQNKSFRELSTEIRNKLIASGDRRSSYAPGYGSVAHAAAEKGELWALRYAVSPQELIDQHDDQNVFLWRDDTHVLRRNATAAIEAGDLPAGVPVVFVTCVNEASPLPFLAGPRYLSDASRLNYARYLGGYHTLSDLLAEPYIAGIASEIVKDIIIYGAFIYWAPMKRMAEWLVANGHDCWLLMDNYNSQGIGDTYCDHTSVDSYILGSVEFRVGMDDPAEQAKIHARDWFVANGWLRMLRNFCIKGDPAAGLPLAVKLFDSEPAWAPVQYNPANRNWNIVGRASALNAINAPAALTNQNNGLSSDWADLLDNIADGMRVAP
jgi:hypothetical protein